MSEFERKSIDQILKEIAYGEGLEAGFHLAAEAIDKATNCTLALREPADLIEWKRRTVRLRDELVCRRHTARGARRKPERQE